MNRLYSSNTSQNGMDASASAANSRGADRIQEFPRARHTIPSANRMKPVQQIGVFHDQNGSMRASVAASETIMIAAPEKICATEDDEGPLWWRVGSFM